MILSRNFATSDQTEVKEEPWYKTKYTVKGKYFECGTTGTVLRL